MQFIGAEGSGMSLLVKITSSWSSEGEQAAQGGGAALPGVKPTIFSKLWCPAVLVSIGWPTHLRSHVHVVFFFPGPTLLVPITP